MIFLDSWVWIEFFAEDERWRDAEAVIERISERGAVLAPTVLMEVRYRIGQKYDAERADRVVEIIQRFDELEIAPITTEAALTAARLREKYYQRGERELSYADAIHLAIAVMTDCDVLYSGDSDFKELDEIETEII
ncbi:PIN domain-containing protein [Halococcus dombrowskii]|uniref:Ribonuclease VapC n=1 Tax=Halococcus dombrowskii TaxID=179637 RepID=A0AAX3APB3_HALDO|nr:PIN domain-containing protein [Halococcus dombrowskii]UOO95620.1 PIN domain-containing protein [Halococcus dombrowskii]